VAILCRDHNLLFIQAPRTACTAIARLLLDRFGGEHLPGEDIVGGDGFYAVPRKHCSVKQLLEYKVLPADYRSKWVTFTSIRNPFDSLVSMYVKKRDKYQPLLADPNAWIHRVAGYVEDMDFCRTHSFEEWLDKHYAVSWLDRTLGRGRRSLHDRYTFGVNSVMRFERLQQDFEQVMRSAGITGDVTIPAVNATPNKSANYQSYYTERARMLVEYTFKPDLDRYGYTFEGLGEPAVPLSPAGAVR
jgi:hypothetical protein